jgi:hypothetical protein
LEGGNIITIVLTVEELNGSKEQTLDTNGTVVGLKPTKQEEEMARALVGAVENYLVRIRMPVTGGQFIRSDWPIRQNGYAEAVKKAIETD